MVYIMYVLYETTTVQCTVQCTQGKQGMKEDDFKEKTTAASIEYTRVALGCTLPPVWLVSSTVYLI